MTSVPVSILDFALMLQAAKAMVRRTGGGEIGLSDRRAQWWFSMRDKVVGCVPEARSTRVGSMVPARPRCSIGSWTNP